MANAKIDNNGVPTTLGTSNADGRTLLSWRVHPTTHVLQVSDGSGGSDLSLQNARRDENGAAALMGISNDGNNTPTEVYVDSSTKQVLIKST